MRLALCSLVSIGLQTLACGDTLSEPTFVQPDEPPDAATSDAATDATSSKDSGLKEAGLTDAGAADAALDASPSKDAVPKDAAPSDASSPTAVDGSTDASSDAGSVEYITATFGGVTRTKTAVNGFTVNAGKACLGQTSVGSDDGKLMIDMKNAAATGPFNCNIYAVDKPDYIGIDGSWGTCKATITTYDAVGGYIVGSASGSAQAVDKSLVSFTASFKGHRKASQPCSEPAPPP